MASRYVPLAVGAGLLHGHAAPAMSPGWREPAALRPDPAARDPLVGLVGAGLASVGKDPPRRGYIAVRVAPAIWTSGAPGSCSQLGISPRGRRQHRLFTRGSVPSRDAPSERQELMNHAVPYSSESGLSPRYLGGMAVACSDCLSLPESSGGPLPASLASRPL